MLFGGFFLNADNVPNYFIWFESLSFVKYAFRLTINFLLGGLSFYCKESDLRDVPVFASVPRASSSRAIVRQI